MKNVVQNWTLIENLIEFSLNFCYIYLAAHVMHEKV